MSKENRLYISTFINAFGSWLTFIALALITQEKFGSSFVPVIFLIQTLPGIFLSRSLVRLVPAHWHGPVFALTQILLALNSLWLVFDQSFAVIISHLLIAAVLRSLSGPLLNSLMGVWITQDRDRVFTRCGAIQAATLALAPAIGAWIKTVSSAEVLFLVDALSFLFSLGLLLTWLGLGPKTSVADFRWQDVFADFVPRPKGLPAASLGPLIIWFLFLTAGAILNAIEFRGFEEAHLSQSEIGYALAAWGVGNLIAFLYPVRLGTRALALAYALALGIFVVAGHGAHVIFAFALAGATSAYLAGRFRSDIQATVSEATAGAHVWAFSNQVTQIINLVAYASAGMFLVGAGFGFFAIALMISAAALVFAGRPAVER